MILDFYHLHEQPFGATPDTAYLFASPTHREALASILCGIDAGRGFIALIASPGMGKTTLLFRSLNQLTGKARTVFIFQAVSTPLDFLRTLLRDLGVDPVGGGLVELQAKLTDILAGLSRQGQQLVVVIDEAQNLDNEVLEFVRTLSNFETPKGKLMQIILAGQLQLASKLSSPDLVQLRQRVSVIAHLKPLSAEDTRLYIRHRLNVAGCPMDETLFTPEAIELIAVQSEGIPRNINNLCFNALAIGCALRKSRIDVDVLREVIADLDLASLTAPVPGASRNTAVGKTMSSLRVWMPRAALAGAALFALSTITPVTEGGVKAQVAAAGTQMPDVPRGPRGEKNGIEPVHQPPAVLDTHPSSSAAEVSGLDDRPETEPLQESVARPDRIPVTPGMTLSSLCAQLYTDCHTKEMDAIRQLNPWLLNGNELYVGQTIRVPSTTDWSSSSNASAKTLSSDEPKGAMSQ
jgi:type II secretory pathway predicted ATPase ExeA